MRRPAAFLGLGVIGLLLGVVSFAWGDAATIAGLGAGVCAVACAVLARRELSAAAARHAAHAEHLRSEVASLQRRTGETGRGWDPDGGPGLENWGGASTSLRSSADHNDTLTDRETGLFSEGYFKVALDARIAAARRRLRPVSVVLIDVVAGLNTADQQSGDPHAITAAIRATLREADTAARLGDGRFAVVLEDTPENGAIWTIERLRSELTQNRPDHTVWAGVACYPAHAFDTAEILFQAEQALVQASEWHQDRIEIANTD